MSSGVLAGAVPEEKAGREYTVGTHAGWVYALLDERSRAVKIGRTRANPFTRKRQLESSRLTSTPYTGRDLKIVHLFFCEDVAEAERDLHRFFSPYRIRGEWFRDDILSYLEDMTPDIDRIIPSRISFKKNYDQQTYNLSAYLFDEDLERGWTSCIERFYVEL